MNIHLEDSITSNFKWGELIASRTLDRYNEQHPGQTINNMPNGAQQAHLRYLCEQFLQPLRNEFGPIHINSGFRCQRLNELVGGASDSWHTYGSAVDICLPSVLIGVQMVYFIHRRFITLGIGYDELILSQRGKSHWLHVAYNAKATPLGSTTCFNGNRLKVSILEYKK